MISLPTTKGNEQLLHTRIHHKPPIPKNLSIAFFVSVLHIRTSQSVRWHVYCLLGFCNEPRGTDLDTHDLLTTGRPYSSGGLLVSKGGSDGSGSLLRTLGGATIKEATVYLFYTHPCTLHVSHIVFIRLQHRRGTI